jgi:DhnA family fructose-bisphosphate aldolase class Ia
VPAGKGGCSRPRRKLKLHSLRAHLKVILSIDAHSARLYTEHHTGSTLAGAGSLVNTQGQSICKKEVASRMSPGKTIRMKRLIEPQYGSCIVCALDHGMTSPVFLEGLFDTRARTREAIAGGANVFMLGRGMARRVAAEFTPATSLALMLSAAAAGRPQGSLVTPIGSVREALRLGADAVVVYVALAGENEAEMIEYASQIGEACDEWGMPFIAEAEFPNAYQSLSEAGTSYGSEYLLRNARLCAELGADIVKVNWSGDQRSFANIVNATGAPVIVAGGTLVSDAELLTRMEQAVAVGAIGCSVGRNIFQHRDPTAITRALCRVIREKWSARAALAELESRT